MFAWIAALAAAVVAGVIIERLRSKPRVVWYTLPRASFRLPIQDQQPFPLHAEILVVQNLGNAPAEEVELTLLFAPQQGRLSVAPPRGFSSECLSDGQFLIRLGSLAPREWLHIQVLYNDLTPTVTNVRSKTGLVSSRQIIISPRLPQVVYTGMLLLMLLGGVLVVGLLIWLAQLGLTGVEGLLRPTG